MSRAKVDTSNVENGTTKDYVHLGPNLPPSEMFLRFKYCILLHIRETCPCKMTPAFLYLYNVVKCMNDGIFFTEQLYA